MRNAIQPSARGFGYQPDRSHGYLFDVKHHADGGITIYERIANHQGEKPLGDSREKVKLNGMRWRLVQGAVAAEFNHRLQQDGLRTGRWLKNTTPLAPHLGKELVLLAWAIDDQDTTVIPRMLANWRGLAPEERWWFYTTINASVRARAQDQSFGWKAAIKTAFLDEPRDIGLESLRAASESDVRHTQKQTDEKAKAMDSPMQGRLFAEPDEQGYDADH